MDRRDIALYLLFLAMFAFSGGAAIYNAIHLNLMGCFVAIVAFMFTTFLILEME